MKNMKIAILSMQRVVNYGSVLQAYSLQKLIEECTGEKPVFIDIEEERTVPSDRSDLKRKDGGKPMAYPGGLLQKAKRYFMAKGSSRKKKRICAFMEKQLGLKKEHNYGRYDWVVIGSDEVFNHRQGVNLQLHGDVRQADRVLSYAASCGAATAEDVSPVHREQVCRALNRLQDISVRDAGTAQYVQALCGRETVRHLDPVLVGPLHQRHHKKVHLPPYLLVYAYGHRISSEEEIRAIQAFAKKQGLKTVAVGGSQFWCDYYMAATPMRLLDYFHQAEYVITDTFHGCVFSVLHKKKFGVLVRESNRNKITGLLKDLQLERQQIEEPAQLEQVVTAQIDYDAVEQLLEKERRRSKAYLRARLGYNDEAYREHSPK